jgi:ribonuclease-3
VSEAVNSDELESLQGKIGYSFRDHSLLTRSLTHSSLSQESSQPEDRQSNEQMEFLGDAVLGLLVSEALLRDYPQYTEGQFSKLKAQLVSASFLHEAALELDLGRYLRLGRGEEKNGGRSKKALLSDAFEALIAALYLDGGLEPARALVVEWVLRKLKNQEVRSQDYKTQLQELLQHIRGPKPRYTVVRESGPEHKKIFTVELWIDAERMAVTEGITKKDAEQAAARIALEILREKQVELNDGKTN